MRLLGKELMDVRDSFSCTIKEGEVLYKLAMKSKEAIVEIGSWKGYSTIWLAKGSEVGNRLFVYTIDIFDGDINKLVTGEGETYEVFLENIKKKGVNNIVVPMAMKSEDAEKDWIVPIGLLFIDGDHEDIEKDYARWYPHLEVGGIIALHDTVYGYDMLPYKVAIRELYKSGNFTDIKRVGCITYARKVQGLSNMNRIKNKSALCLRYIYQLFIPYYTKALILADKCIKRIK
ncbi:hypothetical protein LCGC14_2536140 [marine sediment metagenome]|uniref:O-methyltransferase domain-containing protein n=1 Tax=marine sediment metagenome TaxID=412755 RepID=A0A0F9ASH4_9ZZZZ